MAADPYVDLYRSRRTQARGVALPAEPRVPANDSLTPLERAMADERENRTRLDIMTAPPADQVARQTRIAREAGVAPALVDDLDGAERAQNADKLGKVFGQYPAFGRWGAANPRGAVAAQDDHESLGALGRAYEVLAGRLQQTTQMTGKMGWGSVDYFNDIGDALAYPVEAALATVARPFGINIDPDTRRAKQRAISQGRIDATDTAIAAADARATTGNYWIDQTTSGLASLAPSLAAIGLGIATKNPGAASGFMGLTAGGGEYATARTKGLDLATAARFAATQGTTEALTERIPAGKLVEAIAKKTPFGKTLVRQLGEELKGENIATIVQDLTDWAYLPENADKSLGDYIRARPQAALDTSLATIGGTAAQTGIAVSTDRTVRAGVKVADRIGQAAQARREAGFIDKASKAAEASKLRQRDPEAYRALVKEQAEESGAVNAYVSGEALLAYYQSDSYDPDSDPFSQYEDQANEAAATGGDVVIPISDALTDLTGSKGWEALRPDMRLSAGGITPREADTFDSEMEDVLSGLTDEMAASEQADAGRRTALERLTDSLTTKIASGGYAAPAARTMATVLATRAQTRYERQGFELIGNEYDNLEVRQVLPDVAKPFVTRTEKGVDVSPDLINEVKAKRGPSLLEFVAKRGGISDPGGDLRSMGFAPIKGKAAKGQRKVINDSADAVDRVFEAAIEAGYFPDILGTSQERYEDLPDPAIFLEALDREYRGAPVYASGQQTEAANAVRAMLEQAGYDPAKMSAKDIRDVIAEFDQRDEREGYEQTAAFDKWFGDSKVVDAKGDPLVVYHGTASEFDAFSKDASAKHIELPGFFFTPDAAIAQRFAESASRKPYRDADGYIEGFEGANITAVYLSIQNPAEINLSDRETGTMSGASEVRTLLDRAQKDGHDGAVITGWADGSGDVQWVAFRPEQIKSINNRGTFDPNDARILYQDLFDAENATDPAKAEAAKQRLKLRAEAPLRGENRTGKAQDGTMGLGLFDTADQGGLFQTYGEGARARVIFDQQRALVELFANKNLSSFLHETGHIWLEELRFDASLDGAPQQVKDDWQKVQDWFAANGHPLANGQIPVEAHELWARGVERYLMEGKAPSSALTRIFETFRGWLTQIYKTVDALRSPITPEIRGVMDRLIATDEEIATANERQNIAALFKQAADAAMSAQEFAAYQAQVAEARADAHGKLLDKTMRVVRARETKRYRDARETLLAETTEAMDATPLLKSLAAMKTQPISAEWLNGEGIDPATLPVRVPPIVKPGGADPQIIAELAGFATARDMLTALQTAQAAHREAKEGGDKRSMRQRMIENSADAEMERRHGDPLNDGSIEREALEAVHSDMQGEVIATELRVLSRKSGKRPTPYALAKDWARNRIRSGKVADEASPSAIQRYARAAAKAGREAEAAMLKQDADEAFRQKQFQMLNNALVSEAKQAEDEVNAAVKRLDDIATIKTRKSIDQDYLEQAQALLEDYDFRRRTNKELAERGRFEAWAEARRAEGFDVLTPDRLAPIGTNWKAMTVDQLTALDEAVKQIIHMGRYKQTMLDNQERREWDEIFGEAEIAAGGLGGLPPKGSFTDPGFFDAIRSKVATLDAALLKMEQVFSWLDGGDINGVFTRVAFRPVAAAQALESAMLIDYYGRIREAMGAVPAKTVKRWADKVTIDLIDPATGLPAVFTRQKLVAMALNVGNAGNRQRLASGYGWNENGIMAALNAELTADEWALVQKVWDIIDTLWPAIEAMERNINGVAPDKVEATEVVTPFGTLRGGYYPAVYDSTLDLKAEENAGKTADLFESSYTRATTRASSTKDRAEKVTRPILLDLGVINRHLGEVIHDITHREAVMQAHKFLTSERVSAAVEQALGPEIRKQFRPWVKFVANSWALERAGNEGWGRMLGAARANTTVVGMGLRLTTMITQIAGYANSAAYVGTAALTESIARTAAHPIASFNFVMERSDEIRHRMDTLDRDIRLTINDLAGRGKLTSAKRFVFHGIGYMDRLVVIPTWLAEYNKGIAAGLSEIDAAYAGDKAVRLSQGAASPKDLAAIATGQGKWGEALRLGTMFYSYLSSLYNQQRTLGRDVVRAKPRDLPKLAARSFYLFVVAALLPDIIKMAVLGHGGPDDEEEWGWWTVKKMLGNVLGPIPFVRDVYEPAWDKIAGQHGFDYKLSPIQNVGQSVADVFGDVGKVARGDETKHATKDVLVAVGYFTGLVPGQIANAAQFAVDVGSGDADPQTIGDWVEGISSGRIKDD